VPRATGSALLDHGHTKVGASLSVGALRMSRPMVPGARPEGLFVPATALCAYARASSRCAQLTHSHRAGERDRQVLASVYGPRECASRAKEEHNRSIINCQVVMAPFAQVSRTRLRLQPSACLCTWAVSADERRSSAPGTRLLCGMHTGQQAEAIARRP
jgi:hypothetical protein